MALADRFLRPSDVDLLFLDRLALAELLQEVFRRDHRILRLDGGLLLVRPSGAGILSPFWAIWTRSILTQRFLPSTTSSFSAWPLRSCICLRSFSLSSVPSCRRSTILMPASASPSCGESWRACWKSRPGGVNQLVFRQRKLRVDHAFHVVHPRLLVGEHKGAVGTEERGRLPGLGPLVSQADEEVILEVRPMHRFGRLERDIPLLAFDIARDRVVELLGRILHAANDKRRRIAVQRRQHRRAHIGHVGGQLQLGAVEDRHGERFFIAFHRIGEFLGFDEGAQDRATGAVGQAVQRFGIEVLAERDREEGDPALDHFLGDFQAIGIRQRAVGAQAVAEEHQDALAVLVCRRRRSRSPRSRRLEIGGAGRELLIAVFRQAPRAGVCPRPKSFRRRNSFVRLLVVNFGSLTVQRGDAVEFLGGFDDALRNLMAGDPAGARLGAGG